MVSVAGLWWTLPPQEDPTFYNVSSYSSLFFVFLGLVSVASCLWLPSWQDKRIIMVSVVDFVYGFRRGREHLYGFRRCCFLWLPAATGPRLSL